MFEPPIRIHITRPDDDPAEFAKPFMCPLCGYIGPRYMFLPSSGFAPGQNIVTCPDCGRSLKT